MKTIRFALGLIGTATALFTMGCATPGTPHAYKGKQLDPSELALIVGTTQRVRNVLSPSRERVSIAEVDGNSMVPWYSPAANPTAVYLLPGRHKLDIQYEYVHGVATGPIWVDALSNRTYRVKAMSPEGRTAQVFFVIEDITAQTLVGGEEDAATTTAAPAPAAAP